jgi:hypothetical protein
MTQLAEDAADAGYGLERFLMKLVQRRGILGKMMFHGVSGQKRRRLWRRQ